MEIITSGFLKINWMLVILKRCKTPYETKIAEALLIRKFHPKLNKQLMTKGTSYLLKVF